MNILGKSVPRRAVLRGLGASVALPFLDAMTPALSAAPQSPNRLLFTYIPIGAELDAWTPKGEGVDYELSRALQPLEAFRDDFTVYTGLGSYNRFSPAKGGAHASAGAAYLTGLPPKKTAGADVEVGVSADQVCAQAIGQETPISSLQLGCEDSRLVGACDGALSCAYQNCISWRTPNQPLPPETNPRAIFERLFGSFDPSLSVEEREQRIRGRKSILDLVHDKAKRLSASLGGADQRKLDEYLYGVREIERRIDAADADSEDFTPAISKPSGIPVLFSDYLQLMFDLLIAAMQADRTRVMTFQFGREASLRTYAEIGVPEPHHPLTHHSGDPAKIEKVKRINVFHSEQLAEFLAKLKAVEDGDGSLLDHALVVHGSGLSDGDKHSFDNLPMLVAGRAGGYSPGRHIVYAKERKTPVTNLFLTLLARMGVEAETLGDSTGQLKPLSEA